MKGIAVGITGAESARIIADNFPNFHIHDCNDKPEDCAITYIEGDTLGVILYHDMDPEGEFKLPPTINKIKFCPFCGEKLDDSNNNTETIEDDLDSTLSWVKTLLTST